MYLSDNEIFDISLQTESYFIPNDFKITSKTIIKKENKFEKKIRNRITNYRIFKRLL